jgi:hypothetical protein
MPAQYSDSSIAVLPATGSDKARNEELRIGSFLYQAATMLAILLFLVSFWSC